LQTKAAETISWFFLRDVGIFIASKSSLDWAYIVAYFTDEVFLYSLSEPNDGEKLSAGCFHDQEFGSSAGSASPDSARPKYLSSPVVLSIGITIVRR
jgi:hypothetical protein